MSTIHRLRRARIRFAAALAVFGLPLAGLTTASSASIAVDATVAQCQASQPDKGYRMLYDGTAKSLSKWRMAGPGEFIQGDDCTIRSSGGMGLLWYPKRLKSYSLKAEWMVPGDENSGVFVGFPDPGDDPWVAVDHGYEIQIDATDEPDRTTGAIYSFQGADEQARDAALNPPGEWNAYQIKVVGQRIRVYLNGALINDFTSTDPGRDLTRGYVGLQNHGDADDVYFRDVQVKRLKHECTKEQ